MTASTVGLAEKYAPAWAARARNTGAPTPTKKVPVKARRLVLIPRPGVDG